MESATKILNNLTITSKPPCAIRPPRKVDYQDIPTELWLHTFSFLQEDKPDLTSLALVSRSFATLVQPLVFQRIIIRPVCGRHPTSRRLTCPRDGWEWIVERMQFCTQDRIAHAVTAVEFSPKVNSVRRDRSHVEVSVVADMIIRMLPLFPRLRSFRCAHSVLQQHHLYTISGISNLHSFHAIDCHLPEHFHDHVHAHPVKELTMTWRHNTSDLLGVALPTNSHRSWFPFMHPAHLSALNIIPLDDFLGRVLADLVNCGAQFHVLRTLGLPWMAVESNSFIPLMERTPFLQELRFTIRPSHQSITMAHPLPQHLLQDLSVLEVPVHSLPLFLRDRTVKELSCATTSDDGSLPTDIIKVFGELPPETLSELSKLSLDMKCITGELLDCLARKVPHLTVLDLNVRSLAWGPSPESLEAHTTKSTVAFFLSLQLPRALEYLYIGKQYATATHPPVRQVNGDDVLALRTHFPSNYPSLNEAHFYAANFHMIYEKGNVTTITQRKHS